MQKRLIGDAAYVVDASCFRQLIAWAGSKERFGNTPETKNSPDLSKLNPGCFRFQAMALRAILTATPSFPKQGLHLSLVCFASKFGAAYQQRIMLSYSNDCNQVGQTIRRSLGPVRFADRRLRSNPKKPRDIKAELAPI